MASINTYNEKWAYDAPLDAFTYGELYNTDVIDQSIEMILSSLVGHRLFNRSFGTDFSIRLFDNMDVSFGQKLLDDTLVAIKRWENRIIVLEDQVRLVLDPDSNKALIEIPYYIPRVGEKSIFKKKIIG